jgi:hypothetical protein
MQNQYLIKEKLYKLPFTKHNNPNGWIEPTTYCQLKCPHCYRGADKANFKPIHRDLKDVLTELDELVRIRNIQTLTIAGGEPLLYPDLDQLIEYAVKKNLNVMINTNGVLISKTRLEELKELGVTRIVVHVDKYQGREETGTEKGINKLREDYCNLFRKVSGISLGFIMPISGDNVDDLDILIPFFKNNVDIIRLISFTILCESTPGEKHSNVKIVDANMVFNRIKSLYGLEYCSYLGRTKSDGISWLYAYNIFAGNKFLGSIDKDIVRFAQEQNYKKEKRYLFSSDKNENSLQFLLLKIFNKSTRQILWKYLKNKKTEKMFEQILLIVSTPQLSNGDWDLCNGCPDAILHEGDLVPSCFLEKIKAGERIKLKN